MNLGFIDKWKEKKLLKRHIGLILDLLLAMILLLPTIFRDEFVNFIVPKEYANMPATCPIAILSFVGLISVFVIFIWLYRKLTDLIVSKVKY